MVSLKRLCGRRDIELNDYKEIASFVNVDKIIDCMILIVWS